MNLHRALTIAGTDPTGGAGIMADLKAFQSRHVYGMAVVTSVVAQNTRGVTDVQHMDISIIEAQLKAVFSDIIPEAIKTGMIATTDMIECISSYIDTSIPYVLDPVMVATSGDRLISDEAIRALQHSLIPKATLITPNHREAEVLVEQEIYDMTSLEAAGLKILKDLGPQAVIIKGGHIGEDATDYLFTKDHMGSVKTWTSPKYDTVHTHGTGCTFSAVITAELGKGKSLEEAISIGKEYIRLAILHNPQLGTGCGPVNHMAYEIYKEQKSHEV